MAEKSVQISVIITTRNRQVRLKRAVQSVLEQSFKNFELIVVNDGGEDIAPLIEELNDRRITAIAHFGKQGAAAAKNSGIRKAQGEYITFLEDNDFYYPRHLEICSRYLELGHKVVYTDAVKAVYHRHGEKERLLEKRLSESPEYERDILLLQQFAPAPCFILLRQLAFEAGLFNENYKALDFWDFLIRVSNSARFLHIHQATLQSNFYFSDTENTIQEQQRTEKAREKIRRQHKTEIDRITNKELLLERLEQELDDSVTMQYPLISIIFLCGGLLSETEKLLKSISSCVGFNYEIIVVTQSRKDETTDFLENYQEEHTRLQIVYEEEYRGVTSAMVSGIRQAKGSYFLLIENDILLTPGSVESMIELAESDYYNGIVVAADNASDELAAESLGANPDEESIVNYAVERRKRLQKFGEVPKKAEFVCTLIKAETVRKCGYPDIKFAFGDTAAEDFYQRTVSEGFKVLRCEEAFIYHYDTENSRNLKQFLPYVPKSTDTIAPVVSVIISTYNRRENLLRALKSVLNQTFKDFEIIVINDSGEDIRDLIHSVGDKRIRYYRHNENKGVSATRNTGLLKARGKYIAYLDDDDIYYKDHLELSVAELEKERNALVYSGTAEVLQDVIAGETLKAEKREIPPPDFDFDELLIDNFLPLPTVVHHRRVIERAGLFDETLSTYEAWDLWIRIARFHPFGTVNKITCQYHIPAEANTLSNYRRIEFLRSMSIIHRRYRKFIADKEAVGEKQRETLRKQKENLRTIIDQPLVSILIPVYNRYESVRSVNTKIYRTVENSLFEIIYIDNNSSDGTTSLLKGLARELLNLGLLQNSENLGFAKSINLASKHARGKYLLFAHDDIEPQFGWLDALLQTMEEDEGVGAAGAKLINPDNTIDHAGIALIEREKHSFPLQSFHIFSGRAGDAPEVNRPMIFQAVSAACMLVRKSAFDKVGGLDERYWNDYSHIDFCFKLAHSGFKTVYQPKSIVIHHKSSRGVYSYRRAFENLVHFDSKWLGKISYDYRRKVDGSYEKLASSPIQPYYSGPINILIICSEDREYTRNCFESILAHTAVPFEITFIDRGTGDESTRFMKLLAESPNVSLIDASKIDSESAAFNIALKNAKGAQFVLMRNDVVVTPGWLTRLLEGLYIEENIGIMASMTNSALTGQRDKNAQYSTIEEMYTYSEKVAEENRGKYFTTSRVEFFCTLISREVVEKIGGFDERFDTGEFVDEDYSLRVKKAGFKAVVIKDVFVHRHGFSDSPETIRKDDNSLYNRSKAAFIKKWGVEPEQAEKSNKMYNSAKLYFPLLSEKGSELYRRAVYFSKEEEYDLAYKYFTRLFEAVNEESEGKSKLALYLNTAGRLCLRLKEYDDARAYFQQELELEENPVRAYEGLGDTYHAEGDFPKASEMYDHALAVNENAETVLKKRKRYFK